MNYKRLAQFALPALFFIVTSVAQAAQQSVDFGRYGSSFFTTDPWDVYYIDTTDPDYYDGGFKSVADLTSNQWIATNYFESPLSVFTSSVGTFNLDGLWLAGAWGSQTLTITGYLNGTQLYETTVDVTTTAYQFSFDFQGIDSFSIASSGLYVQDPSLSKIGSNWVLGAVEVTAVPEPEAYAMLLAGLALVGAMARRRRGV